MDSKSTQTMKIKSDGKASAYYDFPKEATTLNDLIEYREMSFAQGNIFKAAYRLGHKDGITLEYDLNKIIYYAQRMLNKMERGDVHTNSDSLDGDWTNGDDSGESLYFT